MSTATFTRDVTRFIFVFNDETAEFFFILSMHFAALPPEIPILPLCSAARGGYKGGGVCGIKMTTINGYSTKNQ